MDLGGSFMSPVLGMQRLAEGQDMQRLHQAQTQHIGMQNQQIQQQMQENQKVKQVMSTLGSLPGSATKKLERGGDELLQQGLLGQAEKAYGISALMKQRTAHAAEYEMQAKERQMKIEHAKMDQFIGLVQLMPDTPAGWEAIKASYLADNPNPSKLEQQLLSVPWQPGLGQKLSKAFMSAKDQQLNDYREKTLALKELSIQAQQNNREAQINLAQQRLEMQREKNENNVKVGKTAGIPNDKFIEEAGRRIQDYLISQDKPDMDKTVLKSFSYEIASEALKLNKRGMEADEAIQTAIVNNKQRIEKTSEWSMNPFSGFKEEKSKVSPKGTSGKIGPKIGDVQQGYRFKGGDPANKMSWEKI